MSVASPTPFQDLAQALQGITIDRTRPIVPQIYGQLRNRIIDNRLPPGTEVSEAAMARHCSVSRTPLRAAMQQLAAEGLIQTWPQVGSVVAELDLARMREALFIRTAMEEAVARKLCETGLKRASLGHLLAAQKAAAELDDYAAFFRFDEEFHAKMAALADVPTTWKIVQSVKAHVDRQRLALMSSITGRSMVAYQEHLEILDRIEAGDADGAAAAMRRHVRSVLSQTDPGEGLPTPTND